MFFSLFLSKNQKLVKTWKEEHQKIANLATKVVEAYTNDNHDKAKKILLELRGVTLSHLNSEDTEFVELLKDNVTTDDDTKKFVNEFQTTFKNTKSTLINFLKDYTKDDTVLDDDFIDAFMELHDVLGNRIDYEETNL